MILVNTEGSMTNEISEWWIGLGEDLQADIEALNDNS
jgi:hypothetical protein